MTTLFYHMGALGDFLTVLPAIKAWRLMHSGDKIILLGKSVFGELALNSGYIDEVWEIDHPSQSWLFLAEAPTPQNAYSLFSGLRAAILFTSPSSPIIGKLAQFGIKEIIVQNPFPSQRIPINLYHLSLFPDYAKLMDHFGPIIRSHVEFEKDARNHLPEDCNYIVIHPGSGARIKNWPMENFIQLSEKLLRHFSRILWICGEAQEDLTAAAGIVLLRKLPLPVVVSILRKSRGYIGNDSGISHLAASTGCRCLVLFGPSDDEIWKPCGARVHILKARHACKPCHPLGKINERCTQSCMHLLTVHEVYRATTQFLETNR
jgi:heptosyltransferase III